MCNEVRLGDGQYGLFQDLRCQASEVMPSIGSSMEAEEQAEDTAKEREMKQQHYTDEDIRVYGPVEEREQENTGYGLDPDDDDDNDLRGIERFCALLNLSGIETQRRTHIF